MPDANLQRYVALIMIFPRIYLSDWMNEWMNGLCTVQLRNSLNAVLLLRFVLLFLEFKQQLSIACCCSTTQTIPRPKKSFNNAISVRCTVYTLFYHWINRLLFCSVCVHFDIKYTYINKWPELCAFNICFEFNVCWIYLLSLSHCCVCTFSCLQLPYLKR